MNEVLDATLELMSSRSFDDLSISEILDRADQSAGQFYARFGSKEAVFRELCRRFEAGVRDRVEEEIGRWDGLGLPERVRRLVTLVAALNVENRPILRSMFLRIWREPGRHDRIAGEIGSEGFDRLILRELWPGSDGGSPPPERERRVRWAMEVVAVTCRHELLFGALHDAVMDDPRVDELLDVLTRLARDEVAG